jgi:hypothetical protein
VLASATLAADDPDPQSATPTVAQRTQQILSDSRFQTDLPTGGPDRGASRTWKLPEFFVAPSVVIGRLLFYGILAAAVMGLLLALGQLVGNRLIRERNRRRGPSRETRDAAGARSVSLGDIEDLAQSGRLAEAIHLLLEKAFVLLVLKRGDDLPDSMTGREVVDSIQLVSEVKTALRELVEAVEKSHFGGRPVDMTDFRRCWSSYGQFAATLESRF